MNKKALVLGGYGNFGWRIVQQLAKANIPAIICGRNKTKATELAEKVNTLTSNTLCEIACFDVRRELASQLEALKPTVVINTCGPFQGSDYGVAETCINHGIHYIDLADARDYVCGFSALDEKAKTKGVAAISGASTVPGLSSTVVEHFKHEFSKITSMRFGISPGQKADRGLATTQGIMSYVGRALRPFPSAKNKRYGWQDIYRQHYPGLGRRWMANCEIPDLDLLPEAYGIKNIQFSAGLELAPMHLGLWAMSWLVRWGFPLNLQKLAGPLLKVSNLFDPLGSADGGMHIILEGKNVEGKPHTRKWFIIAKSGHGPFIPTIPAIILAKQIIAGDMPDVGAQACVGLITLDDYLKELSEFDVADVTSNQAR